MIVVYLSCLVVFCLKPGLFLDRHIPGLTWGKTKSPSPTPLCVTSLIIAHFHKDLLNGKCDHFLKTHWCRWFLSFTNVAFNPLLKFMKETLKWISSKTHRFYWKERRNTEPGAVSIFNNRLCKKKKKTLTLTNEGRLVSGSESGLTPQKATDWAPSWVLEILFSLKNPATATSTSPAH